MYPATGAVTRGAKACPVRIQRRISDDETAREKVSDQLDPGVEARTERLRPGAQGRIVAAAAGEGDHRRQAKDLRRVAPGLDLENAVRAEDEEQLVPRASGGELRQGVARIGRPLAANPPSETPKP